MRRGIRPQVIVGAASIAFGAVIMGLGLSHTTWGAPLMIVAVLVLAAILLPLLGAKVGSAVLLIITCFVDLWAFPFGRVNIRPEQIAALTVVAVWAWTMFRERRGLELRPLRVEIALLAWFAFALVASLLEAPSRSTSLKVWALLVISSIPLFLLRRLVTDSEPFDQVIRWLLLALALESAYALAAYFSHVFGLSISLGYNPGTQHLDAKGTLWEPNVLGAIGAAGAVAWSYLGPRYFKVPWLGVALCMAACIASFARAAWLAVVIVGFLTFVTPAVRRRLDLRAFGFGSVIGTMVAAVGIIAVDLTGKYTQARASVGATVTNSIDVLGRIYQFSYVLADVRHHPLSILIGGGTDSYSERHISNGVPDHLANLELFIFNDTGVIGLLLFAAFGLAMLVAAWRQRQDVTVIGLSAMVLVLVITTAATESLELMITWLLLGIFIASVDLAARRPGSSRTTPDSA